MCEARENSFLCARVCVHVGECVSFFFALELMNVDYIDNKWRRNNNNNNNLFISNFF